MWTLGMSISYSSWKNTTWNHTILTCTNLPSNICPTAGHILWFWLHTMTPGPVTNLLCDHLLPSLTAGHLNWFWLHTVTPGQVTNLLCDHLLPSLTAGHLHWFWLHTVTPGQVTNLLCDHLLPVSQLVALEGFDSNNETGFYLSLDALLTCWWYRECVYDFSECSEHHASFYGYVYFYLTHTVKILIDWLSWVSPRYNPYSWLG